MSEWAPKRFWTKADVIQSGAGFGVALDGRPVRTPAKALLEVPTRALAEAIRDEWDAQEGKIDPTTMPYTRTANAAIDKVASQKPEVVSMLAEYGDSDLLCYRAEGPEELVRRQQEAWDPLLAWASTALGVSLELRQGIIHAPQAPDQLARLRAMVDDFDHFQLSAFHDLVSLSGSLIVGFAAARGDHEPESLWQASRVDETWQAEQWGEDEEAGEVAALKRASFHHAWAFFSKCSKV